MLPLTISAVPGPNSSLRLSIASGLDDLDAITVSLAGLGQVEEALDFRTAAALSYSRKGQTLLKGGIALNLGRLEFRFVILPGLLFILASAIAAGLTGRSVTTIDRGCLIAVEDDLTIADLRIDSDADSLLPGSALHWYRIDSVLGQGDYWFTYLASDLKLGRPVVIIEYMPCEIAIRDTRGVIHPAAAEHGAEYKAGLKCFLTDAQKLAGIRHQNIAQALNAFEANNSAYIVVAHEQGKNAEQLFDGSTVAEKELLAFVLPILDGLEAIHASGYIHRYIQPSNIIIRPDGSPVLTGFTPGGGALFNPANTLTKHFPSGFAPIELCFGDGELHGPWTDIFSLGATLYQAVVGVAPVAAIERSRMVVQGGTDPLMSVLPVGQGNHSDAFLKAIDHALGFLPTQRPLTVAAWRNELSGRDPLGIAFVIRPESEQLVKLGEDLDTHKLRAQEDHKRAPGCRGKWLGYSAAIAGIVGLGLSLAWMDPGSFASLYDEADEWLSGNLFRDQATETIPAPAAEVPVPEQLAPDRVAQGREDPAGEPTLFQPRLDQEQWDAARTRLDDAAVIAPESETVAGLRDELKAHESRQVSIREVTPRVFV